MSDAPEPAPAAPAATPRFADIQAILNNLIQGCDLQRIRAAIHDAAKALEQERLKWMSDCGDRRYREDDELAIKRGK